ncbi:MAG: hypothetical protein ABGX16_02480 [Pirellulales bacterium]
MKLSYWWNLLFSRSGQHRRSRLRRHRERHRYHPLAAWFQVLETRVMLASDFGDAPIPYPTTLAAGGAEHTLLVGAPN